MTQSVFALARQLKKYIVEFNLFKNEASRSDPFHLRTTILSTRIYIILLMISFINLVVFNALYYQSKVITILNPSEIDYINFLKKYGNSSTSCPCSRVTIPYGNFTSTTVKYHPVCSSIFVSDDWINYLFDPNFTSVYQGDFRALASSYFQLLATFCSHANRSVRDVFNNFYLQTLRTPNVLLFDSLDAQIKVKSLFLKSLTVNNVIQLLQLVRTTTHSNVLQTAIPMSAIIYVTYKTNSLQKRDTIFNYSESSSCYCTSARSCSVPSGFFNISKGTQETIYLAPDFPRLANVSGFSVGCSPLESLLQSTLECLFDSLCLKTIGTYTLSSNITTVYALNTSQTQFTPNTSVELLIKKLFIENWSMKANFSNYYAQCAPILCTHTFEQRNNALYVLTKVLGLYGGLRTVLHLCVPFVVSWWRKRKNIDLRELHRNNSLMQYFQRIWHWIRVKMMEINLFETPTMHTDPFEHHTLKISTWIYLVLLCLSMSIIVLFTSLNVQIENKIVKNPSLTNFTDLEKKYSGSLQCPCSQITIQHDSFISIFPQFHPVCTSWLTSDQWINDISSLDMHPRLSLHIDFLRYGPTFFISLKTLCRLMKTIVSDTSLIFNQSLLITDQAISDVELKARTQQIFDQFKLNIKTESKRSLALIYFQTATMYTTGDTDVSWYRSPALPYYQTLAKEIGNCSCALNDSCKQQLGFYDYNGKGNDRVDLLFNIPNMFSSCFTIESLLQSSLECFFNQTCVKAVLAKIYSFSRNSGKIWNNLTNLEVNSTRFRPDMFIKDIIDEMMIDTWIDNIDYNGYYEQCAPKFCTYLLITRNNVLYVFTTIISLSGGLSISLKIIVPLIVNWIRNRIYRRVKTDNVTNIPTIRVRIYALWRKVKTKTLKLNLFKTHASWNNEHRLRYEIITTRTYLLFLMLAIMILVIYTAITVRTQSFTEKNLSQSRFEYLVSNPRYSLTLDCPCQNISISYNSFISISPHYHQLCSSDFIIHYFLWINLIHYGSDLLAYPYDDYRRFVVPHHRLLFHLCTLAKNTLNDAISIFHSNTLISKQAQSHQAIVGQMNASIKEFISSIPQTFMRTLGFIRQIAHGNRLVSFIGSNWYVMPLIEAGSTSWIVDKENLPTIALSRSYEKNKCSCAKNSTCSSSASINGWIVPGFRVGCDPLESLLQSTLECLYDETCIKKLRKKDQYSNVTIRPLKLTLSSSNITVQSLIDAFMVDDWNYSIMYDYYYAACAPLSCTYIITDRPNLIYIITAIISFSSGLSITLKFITPILVKIAQYLIMRRRRKIEPNVAIIASDERMNENKRHLQLGL